MDWAVFVSTLVLALVPIGPVSFIRDETWGWRGCAAPPTLPRGISVPGTSPGTPTECRLGESFSP